MIPEPGTLGLLGTGLVGLAGRDDETQAQSRDVRPKSGWSAEKKTSRNSTLSGLFQGGSTRLVKKKT